MPKVAYTETERAQIRESLIDKGLWLIARQGMQHTTVAQIYESVGISRTFFYSFFPSKEDFVMAAIDYQQPKLLHHARQLLEQPSLCWRDAVRKFLHECCYSNQSGFAILNIEEGQVLFRRLSPQKYQGFRQQQLRFFSELLSIFGICADDETVKLFINLGLGAIILHRSIPDSLPSLFEEAADAAADFQLDALADYLERLKNQGQPSSGQPLSGI